MERIDWERENEAARQFIYHNLRNMNFCVPLWKDFVCLYRI